MYDVVIGNLGALATYESEAEVLVAFDGWRWELCKLPNLSLAFAVTLLARALRTCLSSDFYPLGAPDKWLAIPGAARACSISIGAYLSTDSGRQSKELNAARRRLRRLVRQTLAG